MREREKSSGGPLQRIRATRPVGVKTGNTSLPVRQLLVIEDPAPKLRSPRAPRRPGHRRQSSPHSLRAAPYFGSANHVIVAGGPALAAPGARLVVYQIGGGRVPVNTRVWWPSTYRALARRSRTALPSRPARSLLDSQCLGPLVADGRGGNGGRIGVELGLTSVARWAGGGGAGGVVAGRQ